MLDKAPFFDLEWYLFTRSNPLFLPIFLQVVSLLFGTPWPRMIFQMDIKTDSSLRAVLTAILGNLIVTSAKFAGWAISFSPSMLAEAVHSLADTLNQVLLFVGIRHGAGKPTRAYPFGKGRARYIWNLVSAMGIFFVGFGFTTYHGVSELLQNTAEPTERTWIPILILCLSLVIEGYTLLIAYKAVNESRGEKKFWDWIRTGDDPTGVAVLLEDMIAVIGVTTALIGLYLSHVLNSPVPDSIAAIVIGCLLGMMAVILAISNGRILMGVSAGVEEESEIREWLEAYSTVERVVSLKTAVMAPGSVRLAVEVEFHGGILINRQQIERDAERIREGDDPTQILFETAERMVRTVGREINRLESDLISQFPQVHVIDLEVN
jgi:zinc transporter 9